MKSSAMKSILDLPEAYADLSPGGRRRFDTIFSFQREEGRMLLPESMKEWVKRHFGSTRKVEHQRILRITNKVLFEGSLFNALRAHRPEHRQRVEKAALLHQARQEPFAHPEANTPEDTFGRLYGRSEVSASNVAKYDALHGLIIFNNPDPLGFTEREVVDHFNSALAWIAAAQTEHPEAKYPVIGWNALWKAGASLVHGHLQVLVAEQEPYATLQFWREAARRYARRTKKEFWQEWYKVHETLGLGGTWRNVRVFASLTPKKEKEVILLCEEADEVLFRTLYKVLATYRRLGVESFNVVMMFHDGRVITRVVDRGLLASRTTDVGVMELFLNQGVVASDPVRVWKRLAPSLRK